MDIILIILGVIAALIIGLIIFSAVYDPIKITFIWHINNVRSDLDNKSVKAIMAKLNKLLPTIFPTAKS